MSNSPQTGIALSYDDLAALFVKLGSSLAPNYLHGSICGVLAAGKRMAQEDWLDWALDQMAPSQEVEESHVTILQGLYFKALSEFEDPGLSFNLLLPDEDAPMLDRLFALSEWAGSFLGAFGAAGTVQETSDMPATIQEILEDLAEIAQVDAQSGDNLDNAEEDFLAIAEHVKVSAITVYLEYNEPPATDASESVVH